jgi:uncharacterized RDD family membrane protein YckC
VGASNASIQILEQSAVEAAALCVGEIAGGGAVEPAKLGDFVGRESTGTATADMRKQRIEALPRIGPARNERVLIQTSGEFGGARPSNLGGVDRTLEVRTPESIAFSYELAGLGSRFLALAVDQAIQFATLAAIFWGLVFAASRFKVVHATPQISERLAQSIAIAVLVVIVFAILFGYFIVSEAMWNGQTPGKRLLGLRVVRDGGYPIDFGASLIRNLIRVGEAIVGYYILAAISALLSAENKRLGDLAAGTIVVRDARLGAPRSLRERREEPIYSSTAYLSGDERALIKRFLERRDALALERRHALAAQLAARVRDRVPPELARLDDESLLERL